MTNRREDVGAKLPVLEERVIRSCQGQNRRMVRYAGQSRWYASLVTAQVAWRMGRDDA